MPNDKNIRQEKKKGLSDKELLSKYEAGNIDMDKAVHKMLDKPSNATVKSDKQKIKRP